LFSKGQKNILFLEDATMNEASMNLYNEGMNKLSRKNRHTKAYAYVTLKQNDKEHEPTEEQIEQYANSIRIGNELTPEQEESLYFFRILEQVDRRERYGVLIDVMLEKGVNSEDYDVEKIMNALSSDTPNKEDLEELIRFTRDRDSIIIDQIEGVRLKSIENNEETNLYVKLGTMHSEIMARLPKDILNCVKHASSLTEGVISEMQEEWKRNPTSRMAMMIQTKLLFDESVSSEEWDEYKKLINQ
jgi:hypothetical protein